MLQAMTLLTIVRLYDYPVLSYQVGKDILSPPNFDAWY
jgi:hypothetical protein